MAQRYGGKYSPQPQGDDAHDPRGTFDGARIDPVGARANLMFLPPIAALVFAFGGGAVSLAAGLAGAGSLALGAWLIRGGLEAEAAYADRKVARRPALPRKMLAAVLAGFGITLSAWSHEPGLVAPVIFGSATLVLHILAFGLDPMKNKGMDGVDSFQQDRVARVVDEAEAYLKAMSDALKRAGDRQVEARMQRFQASARTLIRTVEEDPRDLTAARKYLGVYLMGARDATVKFADIYARNRDAQARADYLELLDDLERNFDSRTKKLLLDDRSDLNIEIEVLRDRLKREGVRPE
ncbi:5-bromo-4-chloroindolyl phosphate hydrolysis family protein [Sulfitobacter sp. D35]|uniref:5-bromo-4-chloroindolyl phosphate hydrolysis family protein n=1 Tax=Sulfitobacter sp. D35 TaxID=3083252 RepID=UPI00296E2794|nr:5-bromo-4-chloroindolyl phosphate hydrolysis family protein [Sulfitobacter sp. D35]MDW4499841.1 5-bromo-4-chloroindolyl phosphate hydrolysis family protein [Sulfitobacter sp. D35]